MHERVKEGKIKRRNERQARADALRSKLKNEQRVSATMKNTV